MSATFREMLDQAIVQSGITLRELARRSGYSASYISEIRNGHKAPSQKACLVIGEALHFRGRELQVFMMAGDEIRARITGIESGYPAEHKRHWELFPLTQEECDLIKTWRDADVRMRREARTSLKHRNAGSNGSPVLQNGSHAAASS